MSELHITLTSIEAGQPRPYADSRYKYRIEIEFDPPTTGETYTVLWEGDHLLWHVARYAWACANCGPTLRLDPKILTSHPHIYKSTWQPEWHEARITELKEISPGIAEVLIIQPFLD